MHEKWQFPTSINSILVTVLNQFIKLDRERIKLISSYAIFATEV